MSKKYTVSASDHEKKFECVWLSNCYVQKLSQSDTRWDEIGKIKCVFISLIGGKKIRSYFRMPELSELWDQLVILSPSPHNRRLGDKLAGKVGRTRNRQACVFFWFAESIIGRGCQGWTPRPAEEKFPMFPAPRNNLAAPPCCAPQKRWKSQGSGRAK